MPFPCVIVSPYDAELFGHWWFEGPQWIYYVMRELSGGGDLELGTPGEYLSAFPIQQKATPAAEQLGQERLPRALGQPQDGLDVAAVARGGRAHAPDGATASRPQPTAAWRTAYCVRPAAS